MLINISRQVGRADGQTVADVACRYASQTRGDELRRGVLVRFRGNLPAEDQFVLRYGSGHYASKNRSTGRYDPLGVPGRARGQFVLEVWWMNNILWARSIGR